MTCIVCLWSLDMVVGEWRGWEVLDIGDMDSGGGMYSKGRRGRVLCMLGGGRNEVLRDGTPEEGSGARDVCCDGRV
jgi:hypothetical protein